MTPNFEPAVLALLRPSLDLYIHPFIYGIELIDNWKRWMKHVVLPNFDALKNNKNFRYDFVDTTRAALNQWFSAGTYDVINNCIASGDLPEKCGAFISGCVKKLKEMLVDMNHLLQCSEHFMLGVEERDAIKSDLSNMDQMIFNVRNQRTMWGPCKLFY